MGQSKIIKIIGIVTTLIGAGASVLGAWVEDKKMEERIREEVKDAIADQKETES